MKVGDKVRVVKAYSDEELSWSPDMDRTIGKEYTVDYIHEFGVVLDCSGYIYPLQSLELVAELVATKDKAIRIADEVKADPLDSHYKKQVEPIDLIEAFDLNFNLGNCIKYIARCNHKGNKQDDLRKALYYLNREFNGVD